MYSIPAQSGRMRGVYPERVEQRVGKFDRFAATAGGYMASVMRPRAGRFHWIVKAVHSHATALEGWSDNQLRETANKLRPRLRGEGHTRYMVAQVFALVREAAARTIAMRHFDVQLIGGLVLLKGMVAEMETGEGKTLVATLPACTLALRGTPVHIITVNDYLARRDAEWMGPIYRALGLTVGIIVHGMDPKDRQAAYRCDVTYCSNKELAFDYLRDRIVLWDRPSSLRLQLEQLNEESSRLGRLLLRGLHFAIIDEADSVLIDEARTPLIISAEAGGSYDPSVYVHVMEVAKTLVLQKDFTLSSGERTVDLTAQGKGHILDAAWSSVNFRGNDEQRHELVRQALVALHLFHRDKHYLVKDEKVQIIDEYTGRLMADRSWERGLHQLIEVKEECEITSRKETKARISYQRFFRRYCGLAGMTGTAREVAGELWSIYHLRAVTIPTNRSLRRQSLPDRVYRTADKKWDAVIATVSHMYRSGRPVLVGTRSVEASEHLSQCMTDVDLPHRVLNARQDKEEAEIIAQAGQRARITVATNMAGRGTDIRLGEGVSEEGGLHVIATERHEARRIDRQLFGRCGRQGDPGTNEMIVSLEDELIEMYSVKPLRWLSSVCLWSPQGFVARLLSWFMFRRAQRTAERAHARMRHDLLRMDEQLSESLAFSGRSE